MPNPSSPPLGDEPCETLEIRIDDAVRDEGYARALEIVRRRSERAAGAGDHVGLLAHCELAGILAVSAIHHERERGEPLAGAAQPKPQRLVCTKHHLAAPQEPELVARPTRGQPIYDTLARPASIEAQHETRLIARAARGERPQAE